MSKSLFYYHVQYTNIQKYGVSKIIFFRQEMNAF